MPFYKGAEKEFPGTPLNKLAPVCFELHRAWGTFRRFDKYTDSKGNSWSKTYFKKFWSALNSALKKKGGTGCTKLKGLTEGQTLENLCTALAMKDDDISTFEDAEYFVLCDGSRLLKDQLSSPDDFSREKIGQIFAKSIDADLEKKFMKEHAIPVIKIERWPRELSYLSEVPATLPQTTETSDGLCEDEEQMLKELGKKQLESIYKGIEKEWKDMSLDRLSRFCLVLHMGWGTYRRGNRNFTDIKGNKWNATDFRKMRTTLDKLIKEKGGNGCKPLKAIDAPPTRWPPDARERTRNMSPVAESAYGPDDDQIGIMVRVGDGVEGTYNQVRSDILKGLPPSLQDKVRFVYDFGETKPNVTPFSWFTSQKPLMGYGVREAVSWSRFQGMLSTDLFPMVAQKLFHGVRVQIHKKGDDFEFMSEGHFDIEERLPSFVAELSTEGWPETLIMDGVVEMWKNGKHQGRGPAEEFLSHFEKLFKGEDKHMVINVFDIMYYGDEDLTEELYADRLKKLDQLPFQQSTDKVPKTGIFNKVPSYKVTNKMQAVTIGKKLAKLNSSRGTIFKTGFSRYKLDGLTGHWYLYKNVPTYDVVILQKLPTKTPLVYTYRVGIEITDTMDINEEDKVFISGYDRDKVYAFVGKTRNTGQHFYEGNIVRVTADKITKYKNRIRVQGAVPIRKVSWDPVETIDTMIAKADDSKVLITKDELTGDWPPENKQYGYMSLDQGIYVDVGNYVEKCNEDNKVLMTKENFKPQGIVEHGARTETSTEYFFKSGPLAEKRMKCKWVNGKWVCGLERVSTPDVLTDKKYIPPKGFSALPATIRKSIPKQFQFWEEENQERRLALRDAYLRAKDIMLTTVRSYDEKHHLVEDAQGKRYLGVSRGNVGDGTHSLNSFETVIEADNDERDFTLIRHWWKGHKAQSDDAVHFDLFLNDDMWVMDANPFEGKARVQSRKAYSKDFKNKVSKRSSLIPPGDPGNSTKHTPAWAERVAEGNAVILEDGDLRKRFKLGKDIFAMTRDDVTVNMWVLVKELSNGKKTRQSIQLAVNNYWMEGNTMVVEGTALSYGVWNGDFYSWEVVSESVNLPAKNNLLGKPVSISPGRDKVGVNEHEEADDHGKVVKLWVDEEEQKLNVRVHINDDEGQEMIKEGNHTGFSVEIDVIEDPVRRIIEEIVNYDRVTFVDRPACRVCDFDLCELPGSSS